MSATEPFFVTRLSRLVMFDLDGTLVDPVPDLTAAVDSMFASLGRSLAGIEKVRQRIGSGVCVLVRRALAESVEHDGVGEEGTEAALVLLMEAYTDSRVLTEVYPGIVDTLRWLKHNDVEIALVTNKLRRFVAPLLDEMKLGRYFRRTIGGDTLSQQKPDPAALLFMMEMTGIEPGDVLFVGDSRNDMLAAKAAGMRCVALTYSYSHSRPIAEETPTLVISDLRGLLPCADRTVEIMLPDDFFSPSDQQDQAVTVSELWMKVIRALTRWRRRV